MSSDFQPSRSETVWSQFPLQPLAPGVLTPFSYSVLAEIASRAWYLYYDRLGFEPAPRARVVRRHKGRVYFNISLSAQMEATHAGLEPLALQVNGQRQPLAAWEKPNLLAGLKLGRAQKKIDDLARDSQHQMDAMTDRARTWYLRTQSIKRWGQAEVLQIMEEIERMGVEGLAAFFAARYNLGQRYARLLADLTGKVSPAQGVLLINNALGDIPGLLETTMVDALPSIATSMRDAATLAWLKAGDYTDWQSTLPSPEAIEGIKTFMDAYGHRAVFEGEMARPRWSEDATLLMQSLLAEIESPRAAPSKAATQANVQNLLDALPASARKQGEQSLHKIAELHKAQSHALHVLTYIWAGTRTWALAAAHEAMVDKRLHSADEVFLFELEEIKQLMTGEWNISSTDEIRATVAQRQREQIAMQQEIAPDLLAGDHELFASHQGLSCVEGKAAGPICLDSVTAAQDCRGAIVATPLLDSGYVLALPLATGFVAAAGSPCDPFAVAAHAWQHPVAVSLGKRYTEFTTTNGAPVALEVNANGVALQR
jgi:pyruvate,water dikinase